MSQQWNQRRRENRAKELESGEGVPSKIGEIDNSLAFSYAKSLKDILYLYVKNIAEFLIYFVKT